MSGKSPHTRRLKVLDERGQVVGEKEVVLYRGLLEMAHDERLQEFHTELLQAPSEDNHDTAIVRATVRTSRGTFTGIGDANPYNVDPKIVPHFIRMAETRAAARALRSALCIGLVSLEEMGRDSDLVLEDREVSRVESPSRSTPFDHHRGPSRVPGQRYGDMRRDTPPSGEHAGRASDSQRRFLFRLLAQRGKSGAEAHDFVHQALGVSSLDEASKHAVSALIDSLKSEGEGAQRSERRDNGHARGNGHANGNGAHHGNGMHGGGA